MIYSDRYFDALDDACDDPWGFRSRWYERRKRLLTVFGSVNAIKRASVDEIAAVKGMNPALASHVKAALSG